MPSKVTGFDKAIKNLDQLARNAEALDGRHEVSFGDLFDVGFMRANTKYGSFEALLEASPFTVETKEDFVAIPDEPWDAFIREATQFESWTAMRKAAVAAYAQRRRMER